MGKARYNRFEYVMVFSIALAPLFILSIFFLFMLLLELIIVASILCIILFIIAPFSLLFILRAMVNRLHDIGHSGWYMLLTLIPGASFIMSLYLLIKEGEAGKNEYDQHYDFEKILKIYPEDYSLKNPMVRIYGDLIYINGVKFNYNGSHSIHVLKTSLEKQPPLYRYIEKSFLCRTDQARIYFDLTAEQFNNFCRLPGAIITHEDEFVEYKGLMLLYCYKNFRHRLTFKVSASHSSLIDELKAQFICKEEEIGELTLFLKRKELIDLLKRPRYISGKI